MFVSSDRLIFKSKILKDLSQEVGKNIEFFGKRKGLSFTEQIKKYLTSTLLYHSGKYLSLRDSMMVSVPLLSSEGVENWNWGFENIAANRDVSKMKYKQKSKTFYDQPTDWLILFSWIWHKHKLFVTLAKIVCVLHQLFGHKGLYSEPINLISGDYAMLRSLQYFVLFIHWSDISCQVYIGILLGEGPNRKTQHGIFQK